MNTCIQTVGGKILKEKHWLKFVMAEDTDLTV